MTLNEEEEVAVIVKKTLADALPLSNTPGPVDVTGEEGFAALSLLYLDARGDLFIKEQQNQPLVWDGTDITIGPTNSEHIAIDTTAIKFKDSSTVLGSLTATAVTLGQTTDEHIAISSSGIEFLDGTTPLGSLTSTELILGQATGSLNNVQVSTTAISMREGTTTFATLSLDTNAPYLRINDKGSNKFWELKKNYNVSGDNDFTVRPETDSIFAFKDHGEIVSTFAIDTTPTTGTGTASTTNVVTSQSMGMSTVSPTAKTMGGTYQTYIGKTSLFDPGYTNMFSFNLSSGQVFRGELTVVGWPVTTSPPAAALASVVGKYSIFVYRNSSGDDYPAGEGIGAKVKALDNVGEDYSPGLNLGTGGVIYDSTIIITPTESESVWTVSAKYGFGTSVTQFGGNMRLVYELRAIGNFTKLSNLFQ